MRKRCGHIEILLSTYNGEYYLTSFINSLLRQDYTDWSLIIRDDGSTDKTKNMLMSLQSSRPDKFRVVESPLGNIGVVESYSTLLRISSADYVMMADQDDIWLPGKVRLTLDAMRRQEQKAAAGRPILVHTNLTVVDQNLRTLAPSYWAYQGLVPSRGRRFPRMMVENVVWGCTAMLNRPLIGLLGNIPEGADHHDWWIGLVAAALGDIVSLQEPHILWRRHGQNVSYISGIDRASLWALTDMGSAQRKLKSLFSENRQRVRLFLEVYRDKMKQKDIDAATAFLNLPQRAPFSRRLDVVRHGLLFNSRRRNIGLLALL